MPSFESPPLGKFVVQDYDGKDSAYPIVVQSRDPKIAGYDLPAIFSACPEPRYSTTHVFVGPVPNPNAYDTRVLWTYMRLPGPWIPFSRHHVNLGPVQGKKRAVAFTTQVATLTATTRTTYEAKDESEYVAYETVEINSNGSGSTGNPAFPLLPTDFYDNQRGAVQQVSQIMTAAGSEVGSLSIAGGIVTQIRYESFPENKFLLQKITETWNLASAPALSGKVLTNEKQIGTLVKRLVAAGTVASSGALVESSSVEPVNAIWSEENTVTVPEVFTAETFSEEIPDVVPSEFKALVPSVTTETTSAGTASAPTLATGDLAISESQQTKFTKRVRKTTRAGVTLPTSLTESKVAPDGEIVAVVKTLDTGLQAIAPSATVSGEVRNLGNGQSVKTEETKPVFAAKVFSRDRPDTMPAKFRAAAVATTTEETSAGTAAAPTLVTGDLSASEQQVTKFLKRTKLTTRAGTTFPVVLSKGREVDNNGILITLSETLASGAQTITPSAILSGNIEDLGDGTSVKTERTAGEVFPAQVFSQERPDVVPSEFQALVPSVTTEITSEGTASTPTLATGDLSITESQATKFTKKVRKTTRAGTPSGTLSESKVDQDGVLVTVTKTLASGSQTITPSATISGETRDLGNGQSVKVQDSKGEVFDAATQTRSQVINFPAKFIASGTDRTEETTIVSQSAIPDDVGSDGVAALETTARRLTKFTVRKTKRTRDIVLQNIVLGSERRPEYRDAIGNITETYGSGLTADGGPLTMSSDVEAVGGGKQIKKSVTLGSYPMTQVFYGKRNIGIPARVYQILPTLECSGTSLYTMLVNYVMDSATTKLCATRTTIEYNGSGSSTINTGGPPTTKDLRYDGKLIKISLNNVLCDAINYTASIFERSGSDTCTHLEVLNFTATSGGGASGYAGQWYMLSQEPEPWGLSGFKITTVEFNPSGGGSVPSYYIP